MTIHHRKNWLLAATGALVLGAALGAALAACQPPAPAAKDAAKSEAPKIAMATPPAGPALPGCETIDINASSPATAMQCQIVGAKHTGHFSFQPAAADADDGTMTVALFDIAGQPLQTFVQQGVQRFFTPDVEDINGDGVVDIALTTALGNVNATKAYWLQDAAKNQFVFAGETSGVDFEAMGEGLFAASNRGSANGWSVDFSRFNALKLEAVGSALLTLNEDGSVKTCTAAGPEGRALVWRGKRMTAQEAAATLCPLAQKLTGP